MNKLIIKLGSPNSTHDLSHAHQVVDVPWGERWMLYQRLQELGIICDCYADNPLVVELSTPVAAVQMWSVLKQMSSSRQELIDWLNSCWHASTP